MLPTLFGITVVCFVLIQIVPGGPVEKALQRMRFGGSGDQANSSLEVTEEMRAKLEAQYGFDKPIHVRYLKWIGDVAHLDFGRSYYYEEPVIGLIVDRFPVSLTFGLFNFVLTYLISIPLGIAKAVRDGSRFDSATSIGLFIAYSIPPFALGIMLIVFLCGGSYLDWFPLQGLVSDNFAELSAGDKVLDYLHHAFLPLLCYVTGSYALNTMLMNNSLLEQLSHDSRRTAEAKGMPRLKVIYKHCVRNALVPIATGLGAYIGLFLTGSLLIEQVFGLDGIGRLSYESIMERDYPVVLAIIFLGSVATLAGNLISDIMYVLIDPRIDFN
jgi:microcin C transport system permease protein